MVNLSEYKKIAPMAWFVWAFSGFFYSYQFVLRASPNLMAQELREDFCIHASSFGLMAACYYYSYAFLQIPMGIFLDRFGPKRVLRLAVLFCGFGAFIFSMATNVWIAALGRIMIGAGGSAAFLGSVRLGTLWFPVGHVAFVVGLTIALGKLGGMAANLPLAFLMGFFTWRNVMLILAGCGFFLSLLIWIFVSDGPQDEPMPMSSEDSLKSLKGHLNLLLRRKNIWCTALYGSLMYVPLTVFADAWGISFLSNVHGMDRSTASMGIMMVFVGSAFGSPLIALWSDFLEGRRSLMILSALLSLTVNSFLIFSSDLSTITLLTLLFLVGFLMTGQTLVFVSACEDMPSRISGLVSGFVNMIVMIGGVIFQPLVGWILDFFWKGTMIEGVRFYAASDYRLALALLPLSTLLAICLAPFLRETYPHREIAKRVAISGET